MGATAIGPAVVVVIAIVSAILAPVAVFVARMEALNAETEGGAIDRGTGSETGRVIVPGRIAAVIPVGIGGGGVGSRRLRHRASGKSKAAAQHGHERYPTSTAIHRNASQTTTTASEREFPRPARGEGRRP